MKLTAALLAILVVPIAQAQSTRCADLTAISVAEMTRCVAQLPWARKGEVTWLGHDIYSYTTNNGGRVITNDGVGAPSLPPSATSLPLISVQAPSSRRSFESLGIVPGMSRAMGQLRMEHHRITTDRANAGLSTPSFETLGIVPGMSQVQGQARMDYARISYGLPPISRSAAPESPPPQHGMTDVVTGEFLAPTGGGGFIGTRDGTYYAPSGPSGIIDTRTGGFIPTH